ncbi:MAG: tyrosine-type recombinase/integrase [Myxococcota bacterium]
MPNLSFHMANLVTDFATYLRVEQSRSTQTVARYVRSLEAYLIELAMREETAASATRAAVRAFLAGSSPSPRGWNNRLAALRAFYVFLERNGQCSLDPTKSFTKQKVYPAERVPLDVDEMLALVGAVPHISAPDLVSRNVALLLVFLHTALRVSEVASLELPNVDVTGRHLLNVRTKGGKRLSLPLSQLVVDALRAYLIEREGLLQDRDQPALFISSRRTGLSVRAMQTIVSRAAEAAGIVRPVSPHLLRHSAATALAGLTGIHVVREILGHSSLAVTQTYLAVRADERRAAIEALAERWQRVADRGG